MAKRVVIVELQVVYDGRRWADGTEGLSSYQGHSQSFACTQQLGINPAGLVRNAETKEKRRLRDQATRVRMYQRRDEVMALLKTAPHTGRALLMRTSMRRDVLWTMLRKLRRVGWIRPQACCERTRDWMVTAVWEVIE